MKKLNKNVRQAIIEALQVKIKEGPTSPKPVIPTHPHQKFQKNLKAEELEVYPVREIKEYVENGQRHKIRIELKAEKVYDEIYEFGDKVVTYGESNDGYRKGGSYTTKGWRFIGQNDVTEEYKNLLKSYLEGYKEQLASVEDAKAWDKEVTKLNLWLEKEYKQAMKEYEKAHETWIAESVNNWLADGECYYKEGEIYCLRGWEAEYWDVTDTQLMWLVETYS